MNLLNFHTHRMAVFGEIAVCNRMPPLDFPEDGKGVTYYSVGLHPWHVSERWREDMDAVAEAVTHAGVVAVGECGLDRCCTVPMDLQMAVFESHVLLSEQKSMPLVVHCVRALDLLLEVRRRMRPCQRWVWHGYRGGARQLGQLLRSGIIVSFGSRFVSQALQDCPLDSFFLETDDGDVSLPDLYRSVAEFKGISLEELAGCQSDNFLRLLEGRLPERRTVSGLLQL
ncbi:MAG: TatD family hydrolase [Paraprevotella sp.]|nr:TatD family hydrolase [Paraprevotella sp.]